MGVVRPIYEAAGADDGLRVAEFLAQGGDPNLKGVLDSTLLHFAATFGAANVARVLIKRGADLEVKDHQGRTPLHCAAADNQIVVLKLLLQHGADITARDGHGKTALMLAASSRNDSTVAELESSYIERCNVLAKKTYIGQTERESDASRAPAD
jgi:ankyrin repeat protein